MPYNIAMVSDFFFPQPGGIESHIYQLSQKLLDRGHKVIIITHAYNNRTGIRYLCNGVKAYYVPFFRESTFPLIYSFFPLFRNIVIREEIDIIHGHASLSSFCHEAILHARTMGIRTCFTDHSLFGFADAVSIFTNKLLKFTLSDIDHVICVSHTCKENTVLRAALDPHMVSVIPNAIVAENFRPDPSKASQDTITIVVVSRLFYNKGIDLLIATIPRICSLYSNVKFIIAGSGPKAIDIEQMREKNMLQDRVEMLGSIRHEDVRDVMVRGHIYLHPSLTEAFGTVLVEAASCGLYVVCTRVGGVPEVLPPHMTIFSEPEEDDLVSATSRAINALKEKRIRTDSFHNEIKTMYSWSDVAERTERVYDRICSTDIHPLIDRLKKYYGCGRWAGKLFCFLVATDYLLLFVLRWILPDAMPITLPLLHNGYKKQNTTLCSCNACKEQEKVLRECRKRTIKNPRISKKVVFVCIGWFLVIYILHKISSIKVNHKIWDPYEILGISMDSSEKEIRKRYKKLSLKLHPDKVQINGTQTRESVESFTYLQTSLTDEDIRRNYIEYGHPDGKQDFSIGIALPKWIVETKNNYYVLGVYAIAFGFALPYYVGKWWYGNKLYTKDGIHTKSAERFFKEIEEIMTPKKLELLISQSQEYKFLTGFENELENIEKKILSKDSKYKLHTQKDLSYRKAYLLFYAHFHRINLKSFKLKKEQISLLQLALVLQSGLLSICLVYGFLQPILYIMELSQVIVQAIPFNGSPLLQLPCISKKIAKEIVKKVGHPITVQQFLEIPEEKRRALLSSYTDDEYSLIINVASKIPVLDIVYSSFKVPGSNFIPPDSIVQFIFKARCIFLGEDVQEIIKSDIENETDDDEIDFLLKRKKTKNSQAPSVPYAHVPFYPTKHRPKWWVFVVDIKQDRIVVPPISITNIDKHVRTFRVSFQAPSQTGSYTFQVQVKSDTYIGTDIKKNIEFKVEENIVLKNASSNASNIIHKKKFLRNQIKNLSDLQETNKNDSQDTSSYDNDTSDDSSLDDDYESHSVYNSSTTDSDTTS
ncbi:hypothetical protein PORY_002203 [Pneumocystis oryctolagi]|uniref:Uncharacterized protein n=1 Tax=Pneumocystis oryctolagi TaxID=42067 RepID=A0ACB7CC35_9ASCO|nr:hypothetical protein PORY_002203 [Pneumocystis oryctolagi]